MSKMGRVQSGKTTHEWDSQAGALFQVALIPVIPVGTAGTTAVKSLIVDGDDAWALGFLMLPAGGSATCGVERSLDDGVTWLPMAGLALTASATAIEKVETNPLGRYRVTVSANAGTVAVLVRKKVALAR